MRFLAFFTLVMIYSVAGQCSAPAHEGHDLTPKSDDSSRETRTVVGYIFEDANENGTRDDGERGVSGIKVSNGREIVQSDASGKYELKISDDAIVFVIKPRNWKTPVNELNLPQFFYIHKPKGSPKSHFPGVKPTGDLPESVDFPLVRADEPDRFRALLFGDTQPRNIEEVEYIAHDVVEQIVEQDAHGASFGVTLGDIVFDDLDMMTPLNQAIALIDIPWYNVIGNHDLNYDAPSDELSDETFESHYGPAYYSFDYGPTHFLVLDDVTWVGGEDGQRGHYHGGFGERQMAFIKKDLSLIPEDQLVVLLMHIPLINVEDRQELYRLIERRPATVSISAHTHYMEHVLIGEEDGWMGPKKHHHIINVTVCGSWWGGAKDERGIPHATMSDGGPNGYSIMQFDGNRYSLEMVPAGRSIGYQMNLYAPEKVKRAELATTVLVANVFGASQDWICKFRVGDGPWQKMQAFSGPDPAFLKMKATEQSLADKPWRDLPNPHVTPHLYRGFMPADLPPGTHRIEVRANNRPAETKYFESRIIRVE